MRLILLLLLLPLPILAQQGKWVQEVVEHNKGTIYNLAVQDKKIYATSDYGLVVFDGFSQTLITEKEGLPENQVLAAAPSDSGLWLGFFRLGLWHYNPKAEQFTPFADSSQGYNPLPDYRVGHIFDVNDTGIWYQTHHYGMAFSSYQEPKTKVYTPSKDFPELEGRGVDIFKGWTDHPKSPHIKLVYGNHGIFFFDCHQKRFIKHVFPDKTKLLNPELFSGFEHIIRDIKIKNDQVFIATWGGGLLISDLSFVRFKKVLLEDLFPLTGGRNNLRSLEWKNDSILQITSNLGWISFNIRRNRLLKHDNIQGEPFIENPYEQIKDSIGTWIINGKKLFFESYEDDGFMFYPSEESVIDAEIYGDQILLSTYSRNTPIWQLNSNSYTSIVGLEKNRKLKYQISFHPFQKKLYLVDFKGLYIPDSDGTSYRNLPILKLTGEGNSITSSYLDSISGSIFFATKSGLIHQYHIKSGTLKTHKIPGKQQWIKTITRAGSQILYLGEHGYGSIQPSGVDYFDAQKLYKQAGVAKDIFVEMLDDGSHFYLATSKHGIFKLNADFQFVDFFTLPEDLVEDINDMCLYQDRLILAGDAGMHSLDLNGENYLFRSKAQGFERLQWCKVIRDTLWTGGRFGTYRINPDYFTKRINSPQPFLQFVEVMGRSRELLTNTLDLAHNENWVELGFAARSYAPEQCELWYRLLPQQEEWRRINNGTTVSFPSLSPGNYEVQVRSQFPGFEPTQKSLLQINIKPAWWQRPMSYVLLALLLFGIAILFYRQRIAKLIEKQRVKNQLHELELQVLRVQMNPHFLFNALNSVRYYVLKSDRKTASSYLSKFSRLLRFILNITTKEKIKLSEELEGLKLYLEFEQGRVENGFEYHINLDPELKPEQIAIQPLITQPFVENAIWHGFSGIAYPAKLTIDIRREQKNLIIVIDDNGIGRAAAAAKKKKAHNSKALAITSERLQAESKEKKIPAGFVIEDKFNGSEAQGTRVILTLIYESFNS